jgi:hypothetical protein
MTNEEVNKFKKQLATIARHYRFDLSIDDLQLWAECLGCYQIDILSEALKNHLRTGDFFPRISDIEKQIQKLNQLNTAAEEAWIVLLKNLTRSEAGEDAVTKKIVQSMGGAVHLGSCTQRDLDFKRKEFLELYNSYSERKEYKQIDSKALNLTLDERNALPAITGLPM